MCPPQREPRKRGCLHRAVPLRKQHQRRVEQGRLLGVEQVDLEAAGAAHGQHRPRRQFTVFDRDRVMRDEAQLRAALAHLAGKHQRLAIFDAQFRCSIALDRPLVEPDCLFVA